VFGESFAGLSYLMGEDLRFLHLGVFSLKVGVAVWLVCNLGGPSYVVGGDLHCLHLGVLSLEVGISMLEWASIHAGWRCCHLTFCFLSG